MKTKKHRAKKQRDPLEKAANETDIGRGRINDNFLAALVTSKVYKLQVVKAKKGKGSFKRKAKHKGQEPYLIAA
ncbi:alternative ribosome rescue factor ArfA [Colwellia sp. RSH04]|uniref:alternative ribosome rescue factor ArfA n=1 Tax=Colwellia sp. RSH04 TaxID=2305464 RepID=UPI000E58A791|nr:alternative ribosome rescue factor ArfA [Colwellia sp. RSH04]RHW75123.1 alternative ribosome-rescue factor A [Colwellia sp. RSH04]